MYSHIWSYLLSVVFLRLLNSLSLSQNTSLAQLLAQVVEVESLSNQVLCWQEGSSRISDDGTR